MTDKKRERRAWGTGSVFELPTGKWRGQVEAGWTAAGARRYVTVTGKTEAEARRKLRAKQNQIAKEGVPAARSGLTVKSWADVWIERYRGEVRPNSWQASASAVRRHIIPTIGTVKLASLTPEHVRRVHRSALSDDNSSSTALRTHSVLMTMLKAAEAEGHAVPAPVKMVKRPRRGVSDRDAIPTPDAKKLIQAAGQMPDGSRWVAALVNGMRQGECLGLTWDRVNFAEGWLDVSWQLQALPYKDRAADIFEIPADYEVRRLYGAWHLVRPKGKARIIPLVAPLAAALEVWREVAPASPYGLVWTESGRPTRTGTDRAAWVSLQQAAGVEWPARDGEPRAYTLHEARHTTATILLELGVDPEVVRAIMGHSKVTTTRGYQHVNLALAHAALQEASGVLGLPVRQ